MALTPTTELQAVNLMLSTIGEAPVNNITDSDRLDVSMALNKLAEELLDVQTEGWEFNTDTDYTLSKDSDDKFPVPANVLEIDPYYTDVRAVDRGGFLWDLTNKRFTWPNDSSLKVNITWYLAFTDIPQAARHYVTIRAARSYQNAMAGDGNSERFTAEDELKARADLMDAESRTADHSMLDDPDIWKMTRGNRRR